MKQPSTWGRRSLATLLATGVAVSTVTLTGAPAASAAPGDDAATAARTLGNHDADLLAQAKATGKKVVTLIMAADKGEARDVATGVQKLGGSVTRRFDGTGYVLATVPTTKVLSAAKLPGVAAVDLDEKLEIPDPTPDAKPGESAAALAAPSAPGPDTPTANPYMPTNETGAVAFRQQHPTYDGRGVTIGIMDSGVALDNPALQKTSTGERKVVDWFTATDPVLDGFTGADPTWRTMQTTVTGPSFTFAGATWTAPAGTWRVNAFVESATAGSAEYGGDVNRDGDSNDTFGIIWDPATNDIRVDSDADRDFTDNPVMRPYKEKFDVGQFGSDNPATPVREQVPFVVEYRANVDLGPLGAEWVGQKRDFVNIGIPDSDHGSHVAGITAANDMLGNANFDGAAPGAKLVSARACLFGTGCSSAALTTGMNELVVNRRVDVINMSIGGLPADNHGNSARAKIYNRLINDYGVQIFLSAGNNGPGVNTIGDPSVTIDAVAVGSSISKETWLANYGAVVRKDNALHPFSSRGPTEDGGFKPNVVAPGSAISTIPAWRPGSPLPNIGYGLPPGYAMFNGTSMAAPQAAGAAALLLSAAKANDLGVTPAALRRAIYSSASWLPGVAAHEQGNGLVNVPGAWALLEKTVETRGFTADAPVCTVLSGGFEETPNRGTGYYNRCSPSAGGFRPGQSKSYQIKVTRTGGPAKAITHRLTWVGNDGTFRSAGNVAIPLGRPVNISVTANPSAGVHSAILRIDDPATATVDFEVLNTVIAGTQLAAPEFSASTSGSVDRNSNTSFFVDVPAGVGALQMNLSGIATGSQIRFLAIDPRGIPVDDTALSRCFHNYSDQNVCKSSERDYQNPLPGVWEFEVEARRTTPALNNPFQLQARLQGAPVTPAAVKLPTVAAGQVTPLSWSVRNNFGPVRVKAEGGDLTSVFSSRPTIADAQNHEYDIVVPAGASRLDVSIGNTATSADLDLTVFLNGKQVAQQADGDADEAVSIANPAAGTYRVVVAGYEVPAGSTAYDYRDAILSSSLGSVTVSSGAVTLANGATTTVTGSVTARAATAPGRRLIGEMKVVTDEGAVIGRSTLEIGGVS